MKRKEIYLERTSMWETEMVPVLREVTRSVVTGDLCDMETVEGYHLPA